MHRLITDFAGTEHVMEAHCVVARVDLLMSLCEKLEAGLMRSQVNSERLILAIVGRMLAE